MARTGHALEEALANEEARRADVLEAREGELDGAMGAFLLRRASQRHELSSMPDRLAEASRLLERFTQGRYSLQLSGTLDEARRFVAHDSVADRLLDLNQLSSGTRSQLLLAARVAFALAEEGSAALPFFLDETLSQADPERFRAVAQALLVLANEGRQVFYLTCQPADASFWRTEAEKIDSSLLSIQDLVEIRGLERSAELPVVEPGEPALPSPSGLSPQEYARELALPPLDPTRGVSEAHLFYPLSEQLELLYDLLSSRVERVGPWRLHEKRGSAGPLLGSPERAAQVSARVKALGAFLEARRVGRGAPLHRKALADAGVSETFMEPVAELAEEVEWDAARVVEGLRDKRVKRFRAAAIDTIEEFLLDEGFLDPRDMLDEDEIRARVYASLAGELEAGALPREELNALLERWLAAVSRRAACPR